MNEEFAKEEFEIAAGSIVGTDHRKQFVWKNNQDAYVIHHRNPLVAVVADGCGSGMHNEFGARLGANLLARNLCEPFSLDGDSFDADLEELNSYLDSQRNVINNFLSQIATEFIDGRTTQTVINNFLFTLLALVITNQKTYVLGIGDGAYCVNGQFTQIGPYPNNEPPYIVYGDLVKSTIKSDLNHFKIHCIIDTKDLESLCIGTDGFADLYGISEKKLPGKKEVVGPISQFWTEDRYFNNSESIRRRLNLINTDVIRADWENRELNIEHGLLKDDTTFVVVRRRPKQKE